MVVLFLHANIYSIGLPNCLLMKGFYACQVLIKMLQTQSSEWKASLLSMEMENLCSKIGLSRQDNWLFKDYARKEVNFNQSSNRTTVSQAWENYKNS